MSSFEAPGAQIGSRAQDELLGAMDAFAAAEWDDDARDDLGDFGGGARSIDECFERAAAHVETFVRRLGNDDKLRVYALYKQATSGACDAPKPRLMDGMTKHAKWSAWKALGDMTIDDAKARYVRLVEELGGGAIPGPRDDADDGEPAEEAGNDEGGIGGPVFSRPALPFIENDASNKNEGGGGGGGGGAGAQSDRSAGDGEGGEGSGGDGGSTDALMAACRSGDDDALKRVALTGPVDVAARDDAGRTPLHWAADGGHVSIAAALLNMGAEVDAVDDEGQTPLHYAATVELPEMCCLLLESGADPEAEDEDGETPASLGAVEMAKEYANGAAADGP